MRCLLEAVVEARLYQLGLCIICRGGIFSIFGHTNELEITHLSEENYPHSRFFIVFSRWVYMGRMTIQ